MEIQYWFGKRNFYLYISPKHAMLIMKLCAGCLILLLSLYAIDTAWDSYQDKSTAYLIAQGFVTEKLVSPKSVKFPPRSDDAVTVESLGRNRFSVDGYLDSRNTLGHLQRTRFRCVVRDVGAGEWTYERISFE